MTVPVQSAELLRMLPQVGEVVERPEFVALQRTCSRKLIVKHVRSALDELRQELRTGQHTGESLEAELGSLAARVRQRFEAAATYSLRPVINATGVILQTNLGRAPLSEAAVRHVAEIARGYSNLELDLESGERSHRDLHVRQLILDVLALRSNLEQEDFTGKAATVVNNCAAACFLALNTLAEGGEVIVSRGELVEIGGGFRVPDILRKSGALLREVGTTNRTRLSDYEAAITPATKLILRVHRSNFRMEGFTDRPTLEQLRDLSERSSIPVFEDQGTGAVVDLNEFGISAESSLIESVTGGISLVACSGDKLLGGPQCGILFGEERYIEQIRKNPLFRPMRVDKLTYSALEATLIAYLTGREDTIPAIHMMSLPAESIRERSVAVAVALERRGIRAGVVETQSVAGGGTTPGEFLPSFAISLGSASESESKLSARLRRLDPPVIARSNEGRVLLDLRTVEPGQDALLTELIAEAVGESGAKRRGVEQP